jgi:iron complex outermembrane receptor protein
MNRRYAAGALSGLVLTGVMLMAGLCLPLSLAEASLPGGGAGAGVPADTVLIRGQVLDAATGVPLPGAQVRIVELNRSDLTHEDGGFHFSRLAGGRYTVVVERMGYRRATRVVDLQSADSTFLRIPLEFSALELPGFTVTGVAGQRLSEDISRATTVLGGQELARKLDATIAATLDGQPGVTMSSTGPATARPVIRGLGGDRILILEDGERVGDLSSSGPDHAVAIEAATAKQIEVVRGPAALLYGSNALGGVVNVIREEIPTSLSDMLHGSITLQGQSVNRGGSGGGYVTGSSGPIAYRFEGSARTAGDLRTPLGILENTQTRTYNLSAGGSWVGERGYAGLAYRFYDSGYGVPGHGHHHGGEDDHDDHSDHDHADGVSIEMRRHTIRGSALRRPAGGFFTAIEVDGSFSDYYHRELEGAGEVGTEFNQKSGAGGLLARHGSWGPFSSGAIGIQGQWRDLEVGGELVAPPASEHNLAGFVIQEIDLHPVRLEFGGRYDWRRITPREMELEVDIGDVRTRTFGSISASAGAVYDFGGGVGVGASVARAFRTPDLTELYSQGPHLATYSVEIGNPDLGAETGLGTDLFLRVTRDRVKGELAAFRNAISHYIFPRQTGETDMATGLPIYRFAGEDAVLTGLEGGAEWSLTNRLVLDGSASYVRGTLTGTDEPLPLIPPLSGRVGVRYETPGYFVGAGAKVASRQDRLGEFEETTAGYTVLEAMAGYRFVALGRAHTLTLRADNITDQVYRDHLSRIKDLMPQPGRSISLLYRVNF